METSHSTTRGPPHPRVVRATLEMVNLPLATPPDPFAPHIPNLVGRVFHVWTNHCLSKKPLKDRVVPTGASASDATTKMVAATVFEEEDVRTEEEEKTKDETRRTPAEDAESIHPRHRRLRLSPQASGLLRGSGRSTFESARMTLAPIRVRPWREALAQDAVMARKTKRHRPRVTRRETDRGFTPEYVPEQRSQKTNASSTSKSPPASPRSSPIPRTATAMMRAGLAGLDATLFETDRDAGRARS